MKYISRLGNEHVYKQYSVTTIRSISFFLADPSIWQEEKFLELVWQYGNHLVESIRLRNVYHEPGTKKVAHNYDLVIRCFGNYRDRENINRMIAGIERAAVSKFHVDLRGRGHSTPRRKPMDNKVNFSYIFHEDLRCELWEELHKNTRAEILGENTVDSVTGRLFLGTVISFGLGLIFPAGLLATCLLRLSGCLFAAGLGCILSEVYRREARDRGLYGESD